MSLANRKTSTTYTAVDVFAGCGGLSLGMGRAGFSVLAAVENEPSAADTFRQNHPNARVFEEDIRGISSHDISEALDGRKIDLLMGCAPCQGFCSLTRKQGGKDPRNQLPLEMARLIEELKPRVVLMENVPGLETRGKRVLMDFLERLKLAGYEYQYAVVQMADYGIPQNRRRLVLLAGLGFFVTLPRATHERDPALHSRKAPWKTIREAIGHKKAPLTLSQAVKNGGPKKHKWHVVRDLQPQTKVRLKAAIPGRTWRDIDERLRPACHQNGYIGFTNTYGRMSWDDVSPTITSGCTTPCKGRFGHPDRRRYTISVQEAALLQTFPESYTFMSDKIDVTCEMIGNAVPPQFGEALGRAVIEALAAQG